MEPDDDDEDLDDEALDEAGYELDSVQSADSASARVNISQLSGQQTRQFPRRSSVVVIPPMQVCPGDLLVYSKALTHRGNFPGTVCCRILDPQGTIYLLREDIGVGRWLLKLQFFLTLCTENVLMYLGK